jgi:hypothetical protein
MSVTTFKNKIWKKSRIGLFIFGFLHLLFEQIISEISERGGYQNYSFIYEHDEVYDNTINHLRTLNCWRNNNFYSSSTNIPGWATDYVKRIEKV